MAERQKPKLIRVQTVDVNGNPTGMKTVRQEELITEGPRTPLTAEQRARAAVLYPRVRRLYQVTLEKWFEGLERDRNPDREMAVWDQILRVSDRLWNDGASKPYERSQVDRAILAVSIHAVDVAAQTGVSDEFVALIQQMFAEG